MNLPEMERQSTARSRRNYGGQSNPSILALCTRHFGGTRPPSAAAPRRAQKRTPESERRECRKKTHRTTEGPLRDSQTSVSSREVALVWPAEYGARCCRRPPARPRRAPKDRARAVGFHFAVGPGVAGIGSWLGAATASPLAQQFAGVGLLAALQGEGRPPPSAHDGQPKPLRYTPPPCSAAPSIASGEGSKPGTRGEAAARPDARNPLKRLAAFDAPAPAHMDGGLWTPEMAALFEAALFSRSRSSSPPPPGLVPDDATGSEAEDDASARPPDATPEMPPLRPALSLQTAAAPAARPHEPMTPTSPSLAAYETEVAPEPVAPRAKQAVPCTPTRKRAAKPAFGLMTPPPSVGRL